MNIVIFSGGSGNAALVSGLKEVFPDTKVSFIINAYDDGKSTGVCRKVTDTLGVSDIRKNHFRLYEKSVKFVDQSLKEFYEGRYNFPRGEEIRFAKDKLAKLGLDSFIPFVKIFFSCSDSSMYEYNNFSLSNIVYSGAFLSLGYEETIRFFEKDVLNIEDRVILNSFDNIRLIGLTEKFRSLNEDEIVEFNTSEDKIFSVGYTLYNGEEIERPQINPEASRAILDSDLIIISTGTFWSSLYPTFHYGDLGHFVRSSNAKKMWIMNNEEDGDSHGVTATDFYDHLSHSVNLEEFTIITNTDAIPSLQIIERESAKVLSGSFGNQEGKHDPQKISEFISQVYFGLIENEYSEFLFDFDDTLWSRNWKTDENEYLVSVENMRLLSSLSSKIEIKVISGNSFESIQKKISKVFGTKDHNITIWADANSILYKNSKYISHIRKNMIENIEEVESYIKETLGFESVEKRGYLPYVSSIAVKPVKGQLRRIATECLNRWFESKKIPLEAKETGYSTIDVVVSNNSKVDTIYNLEDFYYVGDEVDEGNDKDIAKLSKCSFHVHSVTETNALLKALEKKV